MTLSTLFFIALMSVENPRSLGGVGPAGERGPLQITPVVIEDVNRIYGTNYTEDDCWNYDRSVVIARLYLQHYCTTARVGREPTVLDAARIWNGGPRGFKKSVTIPYGVKFWKAYREVVKRSEAGESNIDPAAVNLAAFK